MPDVAGSSMRPRAPLVHFVGIQASVDSMRYYILTRRERELLVVQEDIDLVRGTSTTVRRPGISR